MFLTTESVRIIDKAEELSQMILKSEVADQYRHSFYQLKQDEKAQAIIQKFMKTKERYEDVMRFGKYHPDYQQISKEMREVKRELDLNDHIAAFKKAERSLQTLLDEISVLIGRAVSEHIKVPTGNPFFDTVSSCGGGCGSGGGCGCKAS
ncbi:YlbF family regulator [Bacillus alveayuensis]|uniref:YlbF family regulator n=1 Tax=Aeribacillus alveayuensis TaxID=279215 RepID=UPI0005D12A46|nr:YlbF family regulator [Bacillus alveayuensis]